MRHTITRPPAADGGYPADSALHQMTDDGGPPAPDPARWADPEWRDDPGDLEAFAADVRARADAPAPPAPADSHWERLRRGVEMAERWRAACRRLTGR